MTVDDPFDRVVARSDGVVVVVTTAHGDMRSGCLVGFHGQVGIDPRRYAVWLSKANHTYGVAVLADHLAVHLLGAEDLAVAELFGGQTGDEIDKFSRCEWQPGPGGVPLLTGCPDRIVLCRVALLDVGGDHVCLYGEPVDAVSTGEGPPLRLSAATAIDAGHDPGDR